MKSAIISIGTELLFGKVVNTNAAYLSQELNELGIDVLYHYTMGDNPGRLKRIIEIAMEDCDLIVCTGGLGPTEDDLTKETICELMGQKLVLNEEALAEIMAFFKKSDYIWTENNKKQAYLPEGGTMLRNGAGTAPGFAISSEGKTVICMPGVPREMKWMWENQARPLLMDMTDAHIYSRAIRVFGIGESLVETMLLPFIDGQTDPTIATYAKEGQVEVRITSKKKTLEEAKESVGAMETGVLEVLGSNVFTTEGRELYEETAIRLKDAGISLAICENVTGGLLTSELHRVNGINEIIKYALVLNNDEAASAELYEGSAFSDERADGRKRAELLTGQLYKKSGADMCLAVTGSTESGFYWISAFYKGKYTTYEFDIMRRTLQLNREFMVLTALHMINTVIDGADMSKINGREIK